MSGASTRGAAHARSCGTAGGRTHRAGERLAWAAGRAGHLDGPGHWHRTAQASVRPQAHGHVLAAAKWRCPQRVHACTKCGVSEPSRVRALTREVAALRAEIEEYRAELGDVLDRFLDEHLPEQHARRLTIVVPSVL